ncbi:MAG: RagB/SusD family nutrient uptake outer membrane protein, partial [Muribaculaceae bacterium]|nr:RagB/SusD family nutrient uptake outer membrane protein [Muribaculaceae bacterium]
MKTIYKSLGIALIACMAASCSDDFLTVTSPTQEDASEYFSTKAHLDEAVVAAYDPMHWTDWSMDQYEPFILMSDIMADDMWVGGSDKNDNQPWHLMMNYEAPPLKVIPA